jgi:hypothetical protein
MQQKIISNNEPNFDNIDKNRYLKELILFIEEKLVDFPLFLKKSSILQNLPNSIEGEDRITENLSEFLNIHHLEHEYSFIKQDNFVFQFKNQPKLMGHRKGDLGVVLASTTKGSLGNVFIFEAKRLPTPGTGREKEYVLGDNGGIERFKTNAHAKNLQYSGMIGYIQKHTSTYWKKEVNSWIDDEISASSNTLISWDKLDKLTEVTNFIKPKISKYKSEHSRISNSNIKLVHYWIDLI